MLLYLKELGFVVAIVVWLVVLPAPPDCARQITGCYRETLRGIILKSSAHTPK